MKIAYIELNTTDQIRYLSNKHSLDPFVHKGIHIFPSTKVTSVSDILSKDFDYFIIDIGVLTNYTADVFSKCHKQFLVCDFCEWKKDLLFKKLNDLFTFSSINKKGVIVLNTNKNTSIRLDLMNNNIKSFPFIENPFQLTIGHVHAMTKILERNSYIETIL